jgi:hypothetical protein
MNPLAAPPQWTAAPTRTGHTKAVGAGPHSGQTLYGEAAERALHPHTGSAGDDHADASPATSSREALGKLYRGEPMTTEDVQAFAEGAADLPYEDLRAAARVLAHRLRG